MLSAVFLAAGVALVAYILVGYPALLALRRHNSAPPVRKDMRFQTTVSIVMAVHNGELFIRAKLKSLLALKYPGDLLEIIVVSDGSTDKTDEIVESFSAQRIKLIRIPRGGKAAALNAGMKHSSGEIIFFTDVRQALDPDALSHLVANFADPSVGVVTGELRFLGSGRLGEQADMSLYWRYELWARRQHSRIHSMFGATGCIYAVRRSLALPLETDTLTDDAVIPLHAFFKGYRVILDPDALAFDYPTAAGGEFRRKLRTLAGLWQVCVRMPEVFSASNRMRFHFLSHKFSRLLLPWAILLAIMATLMLQQSAFRTALLAMYAAALGLALADGVVPQSMRLKRVTSPARTFTAMNAAALFSILVFIVPPATLWRTTHVKIES